jgi:hypothetical protein
MSYQISKIHDAIPSLEQSEARGDPFATIRLFSICLYT